MGKTVMDKRIEATPVRTGTPYSAPHWTDEELLDHLYGIAPEDEAKRQHLTECESCLRREDDWQALRAQVMNTPEVSESFLAGQREKIYQRIEREVSARWLAPLAPAFATIAVVLLAIFLYRPTPQPIQQEVAVSDSQFFSEVYEDVYRTEPKGIDTIYGLFEEAQ